MSSRIVSIVVDAHDPSRLAEFWCAALGWELRASGWQQTPSGRSGATIGPPGEEPVEVDFRWTPDSTHGRQHRVRFELSPTDPSGTELNRLLSLGAALVRLGRRPATSHLLADPEGNEFRLRLGPATPDAAS
jgi:hypothetical protein